MKHPRYFQMLFVVIVLFLFPLTIFADPGYIPDVCDGGNCYDGVCVNGWCEACGWPGFRCCPGGLCWNSDWGYTCNNAGYCINPDADYDCGQVGWPQCDYAPGFCYTGFPFNGMCVACGDFYQPCCPNTSVDLECDYGDCVNGICQPTTAGTGGTGTGGTTTPPGSGGTTGGGTTTPPGSSGTTGSSSSTGSSDDGDSSGSSDDNNDDGSSSCFIWSVINN